MTWLNIFVYMRKGGMGLFLISDAKLYPAIHYTVHRAVLLYKLFGIEEKAGNEMLTISHRLFH